MNDMPLKSLNIINTRPRGQAKLLSQRISALGGNSIDIPSMVIKKVNLGSHLQTLGNTVRSEDIAIFVSKHAVIHSYKLWQSIPHKQLPTMIPIGKGTADTLTSFNLPIAALPSKFNSESLLALTPLQKVKDKTIYLCSGKNTRSLITETLTDRGAQVIPIVCYERLAIGLTPNQIATLSKQFIHFTITTSRASLLNWHKMIVDAKQNWLLKVPTLVIDSKYIEVAKRLSFSHVLVSENAQDEKIINAMVNY